MIEFLFSAALLGTVSVGSYRLFMNSYFGLECHIRTFERARHELSSQVTEGMVSETLECKNGKQLTLELEPLENLFGEPR